MASALFTTAYVHIVSSVEIATQWDLALFAVCSVSLKLLLQELAKNFMVKKRRTPNMRMMAITVAAPTILIDPQLRTVLLCQDNASMTVVGSFLLALAEVIQDSARVVACASSYSSAACVGCYPHARNDQSLTYPRGASPHHVFAAYN